MPFIGNMGAGEMIFVMLVLLLVFGAKKLPELAKGLGSGIKEFKKATREVTDEIQSAVDDDHYNAPPPRKIDYPQQNADAKATTVPHSTEEKS